MPSRLGSRARSGENEARWWCPLREGSRVDYTNTTALLCVWGLGGGAQEASKLVFVFVKDAKPKR